MIDNGSQKRPPEERIDMTEVHRVQWTNEAKPTPVSAIVTAIAELNECDPLDLPPLIESVDPGALNRLFSSTTNNAIHRLAFSYCGYEVIVQQTEIRLRAPGET